MKKRLIDGVIAKMSGWVVAATAFRSAEGMMMNLLNSM